MVLGEVLHPTSCGLCTIPRRTFLATHGNASGGGRVTRLRVLMGHHAEACKSRSCTSFGVSRVQMTKLGAV